MAIPLPPRRPPNRDGVTLPGMELLGFYDRPYQVAVDRPAAPRRTSSIVTAVHRTAPTRNFSERVSALWETTEVDESALDWWKPQIIARRKLGGRRMRMSSVFLALTVAVGLAFLLFSALQRPQRAAEESLQAISSDSRALLGTLPAVEEVVTSLGNPDSPDLTLSTERVLEAEAAARQLFTDAGSESGSRRDAAVSAAGSVLEATGRINRLLAYRLAAERMLVVPALPSDPAETDLPSATEAVAGWRAEIETSVSDLAPEVLPDHRNGLAGWLESLDTWQSQYLDALRQEDAQATRVALADLDSQIRGLRQDLLDDLAEAGGELRADLAGARRQAERLLGG